jgi:hypothetical protein
MKRKSAEALAEQAVLDLIERDAESLIERWARDYIRAHTREPSDREVDRAAQQIIDQLTISASSPKSQ